MERPQLLKRELCDATVRVEEIIWIAGLHIEAKTDALERFCESLPGDASAARVWQAKPETIKKICRQHIRSAFKCQEDGNTEYAWANFSMAQKKGLVLQ